MIVTVYKAACSCEQRRFQLVLFGKVLDIKMPVPLPEFCILNGRTVPK